MLKNHKKRKARWSRIFILFAAIAIILSFTCQALGNSEVIELSYEKVIVSHGDTLWSLIKEYNNPINNMAKAVYEVQEINNLNNASIYVGQVIYIPTNLK
ncbi:MAG: LysM peptidoglycan-binding domain-containing protein [Clostridia bacterium]|jgi:hypothetical protein|nr:LysM peptidoglycan-binding domain-containing protein [Clostridia bacterium]